MKTLLGLICILFTSLATAKVVEKRLVIEDARMNMSGLRAVDFALTVNGGIPAPTLEFTEGDSAEITVVNRCKEEVSIHWHGLLLPFTMDGVAHLTTPSIHPGESYVFKFPIRQSGTYWYHSHSGEQEQRGVYGAIVIHPRKELYPVDHDLVVMINDWIDENPAQVARNLKKDGDYYQYKKKSVRSIFGALRAGESRAYWSGLWTRMGGMDLSDVGYDAFLINGKFDHQLLEGKPGETVRLRVINGSASTYFYVNLGAQYFKVISADGQNIMPVESKELLLGMAETYDILFKIPNKNLQLKATAQDISGSASTWIGAGAEESAPVKPPPNLYVMDHGSHGEHSAHAGHGERVERLDYSGLMALKPSAFATKIPRYDLTLELDGDMSRYTWLINGKVIAEDQFIDINKGDVVRFKFVNKTMMHHPMHLHGHFFRVLNAHGEYAPLKHTVDVGPHKTETIEFLADEPGLWMLHCHNMYHLGTGMAKIVRYKGVEIPAEVMRQHHKGKDPHKVDPWYFYGSADAFTNLGAMYLRGSQTRYQVDGRVESRRDHDWTAEGDLLLRRWLGTYWNVFAGGQAFHKEVRAVIGTTYILPLLIETSVFLDSKGKMRFGAEKRLQWTSRFFSDLDVTLRDGFEPEWSASLMFAFNWRWSTGLLLTNDYLGAGISARF